MKLVTSLSLVTALLLLVLLEQTFAAETDQKPKTVCFYKSWARARAGLSRMDTEDIDPSLCSHMVYGYLGIREDTFEVNLTDPYGKSDLCDLSRFARHKRGAKALLGLGGPTKEASHQFATAIQSQANREVLVQSVARFVRDFDYDGVLLYWWDIDRVGADKFAALVTAFHKINNSKGFSVSVILPPFNYYYIISNSGATEYNPIPEIINYVDFIVAPTQSHDLDTLLEHVAPARWQTDVLEWFVRMGAPPSKVVPLMPLYARTRTVHNVSAPLELQEPIRYWSTRASEPAVMIGPQGPYSQKAGFMSYYELCTAFRAQPNAYRLVHNLEFDSVYATRYDPAAHKVDYYFYDDQLTLKRKVARALESGYAGIALNSIDDDDFRGVCGEGGKFPLLHTVAQTVTEHQAKVHLKMLTNENKDQKA